MVIHIIRDRATKEQVADMLSVLGTYIKLAVDLEREVLAGGGGCMLTVRRSCSKMEAGSRMFGAQTGCLLFSK